MPHSPLTLASLIEAGAGARPIRLQEGSVNLEDCVSKTCLGGFFEQLEGRSVVLAAGDQLKTAAALIELDGWARRLVLCPPDFEWRHLGAIIRDAEADAIVYDAEAKPPAGTGLAVAAPCSLPLKPRSSAPTRRVATEWALLTSGTTGDPKLVVHTLATLMGAIAQEASDKPAQNWATFYDIRRFGGLQIFLRATAGRGSLNLKGASESVEDFLERAGCANVTHISGTPSHWRLVLITAAPRPGELEYVRLSGEIADDAVLNALSLLFPNATIAHAYASTEAGVAFEVTDRRAGFPFSFLGEGEDDVIMKLVEGSLAVKSDRTALRYLGDGAPALRDEEGFVDTGDMIELKGERCFFAGRRGGIINVGGSKVNPEEVEAVINLHASVHASLVRARKNPVTGALVEAVVVVKAGVAETPNLREEIIAQCASRLAPYKVPALVRFAPSLAVTAGGKLDRQDQPRR
jgi:acyl-coenzyme A synthetase/AMP-(fatty) acid ligase